MNEKHGMLIELDRCVGCFACVTACQETWDNGPGARRNWVRSYERGTREDGLELTFYPGLCMQCEDTPCVRACPSGATYTDAKGRVVVDPEVCVGCGNCVPACPYDARVIDESRGVVAKCDLCAPRVDAGLEPACVQTCPAACRVFGDLSDPASAISTRVRETGALPLETAQVQQRPKVYFAGERERRALLDAGAVGQSKAASFDFVWNRAARPLIRQVAPFAVVAAVAGGLLRNFLMTRPRPVQEGLPPAQQLPRHRLAMRVLHWFNAMSWMVLLSTGLALLANPAFTLTGEGYSGALAGWLGGAGALMRLHVLFGLSWAAVVVLGFLVLEDGGRAALRDVRVTRDDLVWLARRSLGLLGVDAGPLPEQDRYNGGQKLFATSMLALTTVVIATGAMAAFHLGSPAVVSAAIAAHALAVGLLIAGIGVHFTMAAVLMEEWPSLVSMVTGSMPLEHARKHYAKWARGLRGGGEEHR